jgi:hypothetical protein
MKTVKVNKSELLVILRENRKKHTIEYKESIKAYRVKAADLLNKELQKVINGKKFDIRFDLVKPISHEKDYDLIIKMVEMSVETIMELEQGEFNTLVNDEWNWKSTFTSSIYSNSMYIGYSSISGTMCSSGTSGCSGTTGTSGTSNISITFSDDENDEDGEIITL